MMSKRMSYESRDAAIEKKYGSGMQRLIAYPDDLFVNVAKYFIENPKTLFDDYERNKLYNICISQYSHLTHPQSIRDGIDEAIELCKKSKFEFISYITANQCILDSLGNPISDISNIRIDVSEINDWILNELSKNPTDLYQLSSRRFEELIAEILIRKGYKVELTPATHDGGKDIYAAHKNDLGSFLYIVECKKYKPTHKVGVNVLRDLYGVLSKERATYGIAVTTSYFSKPAQDFQQELQFQMSLKDFDSIKQWLYDVT